MSEQFANNASAQVGVGGIDAVSTTLPVSSAVNMPSGPQFRILVDSEFMLVTTGGQGSPSWTVQRGIEGTTATAHSAGAQIAHVLTAGALDQRRADTILHDLAANLPAAGNAGRLFMPTDDIFLARDNGASWDKYGPVWPLPSVPTVSQFSWINQGTATATDTPHGIWLSTAGSGTGDGNTRILAKSAPATPWTATVALLPSAFVQGNTRFGIALIESSTGKMVIFVYQGTSLRVTKYSSPTAFVGDYLGGNSWWGTGLYWFRAADDGTNLTFSVSNDGQHWIQAFQVSRTDYLASGPNQIGAILNPNYSGGTVFPAGLHILSFTP